MGGCYKVQSVTVDPGGWTDIAAPVKCQNVIITNAGSGVLRLRTDKADPSTEVPIDVAGWKQVAAPADYVESGQVEKARFCPGEVCFSLKPDSGIGPVRLEWA